MIYHVAPAGSDLAEGTEADPFKTNYTAFTLTLLAPLACCRLPTADSLAITAVPPPLRNALN